MNCAQDVLCHQVCCLDMSWTERDINAILSVTQVPWHAVEDVWLVVDCASLLPMCCSFTVLSTLHALWYGMVDECGL